MTVSTNQTRSSEMEQFVIISFWHSFGQEGDSFARRHKIEGIHTGTKESAREVHQRLRKEYEDKYEHDFCYIDVNKTEAI
uniref:WGR domain-containing protein n=1 Tax=Rhizobium phage IG49 TaxID=3129228 RepID=A0AAU8HYI8_9CAUD